MISYKSNLYSVPPEYMNKNLKIQVYDDQIHVYYNMKLVTIHRVSTKKYNYQDDHYIEIAKRSLPFENSKLEEIAKENLKKIGDRFK